MILIFLRIDAFYSSEDMKWITWINELPWSVKTFSCSSTTPHMEGRIMAPKDIHV